MISLEKRYSYEDVFSSMKQLSQMYSDFVICRIVGQSHDDRLIPMIRIGSGEQTLICTAGVHGRESINPVLVLKMIEEYCEAYKHNQIIDDTYDVHQLLNQYSICFIPLVNPDGYEIALYGFTAIQNPILRQTIRMKKIASECWKYNARGVDINRNFPCKSYIQQQISEYPASENETKALMNVFQDYSSVGYLDIHSRGKIIYYYRNSMSFLYNQKSHRLAKYLQKISKYSLGKKEEEFFSKLSGGNSVNYYSEHTGKPAITVETVDDNAVFPLHTKYQPEAFREIHSIPLAILSMT